MAQPHKICHKGSFLHIVHYCGLLWTHCRALYFTNKHWTSPCTKEVAQVSVVCSGALTLFYILLHITALHWKIWTIYYLQHTLHFLLYTENYTCLTIQDIGITLFRFFLSFSNTIKITHTSSILYKTQQMLYDSCLTHCGELPTLLNDHNLT